MSIARFKSAVVVLLAAWMVTLHAAACADDLARGLDAYADKRFAEAYAAFLPQAQAGVPEMQNLVGFMMVLGRGVLTDPGGAHQWLHKAAEGGSVEAILNLATLHRDNDYDVSANSAETAKWIGKLPSPPTVVYGVKVPEDEHKLQKILQITKPVLVVDPEFKFSGRKIFKTFCGGCHGFDGMAVYPGAPSFLMGERLQRGDNELKRSVLKGKNMMPSWENILPESHIDDTLFYLRAIATLSRYSLFFDLGSPPKMHFIFYDSDIL